jgi:hypothetical protein
MEATEAVAGVQHALADAGLGELPGRLAEVARKLERLEATAPAEAAQHGAGTPRGRRRAGKGDPAGPAPTAQQENACGESSSRKAGTR